MIRAEKTDLHREAGQRTRDGLQTAALELLAHRGREGVTLREKQPIFNLPDPLHMRVRARINESKVTLIRTGQRALRELLVGLVGPDLASQATEDVAEDSHGHAAAS